METEVKSTQDEAFSPPSEIEPTTPQEVVQSADTEAEPSPALPPEGEALSYDAWLGQLETNPDLKVAHEERETERIESARKELRKEEYRKLQSAIQPAITQWAQNSEELRRGIEDITSTVRNAVADGTLDTAQAAKVLGAYNPQLYFEGSYWLLSKLGETVGDESFANEFLGRINTMAQGRPDPDFATEILKRLTEPSLENGYVSRSKYDADIKKARAEERKAALEDVAAHKRADKGPDMARKDDGGSRSTRIQGGSLEDLFAAELERLKTMRESR